MSQLLLELRQKEERKSGEVQAKEGRQWNRSSIEATDPQQNSRAKTAQKNSDKLLYQFLTDRGI